MANTADRARAAWQQRVIEEKAELDLKRAKLRVFITEAADRLNAVDLGLLESQYRAMGHYSLILRDRIARFA